MLGGLGAAGLAGLAGCLGLVGMDKHESSPAGVNADVRDETGYEETDVDGITIEEEVGVGGVSETIAVTNYVTEHEKAVEIPPIGSQRAAVFSVLTSPQIGVADRNVNPIEDMSAAELVDLVADNYDDIGNVSHEDDDEISILGETTLRSRFSADATFDGHDLEVDVHVTEAVDAGDDLLVTIGVYPAELRGREKDNVLALMEGVSTDRDDETGDGTDDENGTSDGDEGETDGDDGDDREGNDTDADDGDLLENLD